MVTDVRLDRVGHPSDGRPAMDVLSEDYDFTHALYAALKAMKDYLRASGDWDDLAERMKGLETTVRGLTERPSGSDPDDGMNETRTLYYALMQERMRYGGDG